MTNTSFIPSHPNDHAVVLFSGGLDSTTCLYWAKANFKDITAISFRYGQRHSSELIFAQKIATSLGYHTASLILISLNLVALL